MEKRTIALTALTDKVHDFNPEYSRDELSHIFRAYEDAIIDYLSKENRVKVGKLFSLEYQIKEPRTHYNGVSRINGGKGEYIKLPRRVHIKVNKLQRIKDIENQKLN